jgi:CheY-like chemotaxis protein
MSGSVPQILVVEDTAITRMLVSEMLTRKGWAVTFAETGTAAVEAFGRAHFDAVLMDIQLPGMSGLEATRIIRAAGGHGAAVPIIAFTAGFTENERGTWQGAGMNALITKPFSMGSLVAGLAPWVNETAAIEDDQPLIPKPAEGDRKAAETQMQALLDGLDQLDDLTSAS